VIREFSGGGLVVRNLRGRPHVAVVRGRHEILALPKGHPEAGESMEEAALREVREETGLVAKPAESSAMSPTSTPAGARRC
jgi:8-oxo-dGTP pyrophosphatase MutT (NUDIX family)